MLRVPDDFARAPHRVARSEHVCAIAYRGVETVLSAQVLVAQPTFVLVQEGVKQLQPQDRREVLSARAGTVLAMRSGTHAMSEFHGEVARYQSLIVSVDRSFLRDAVGVPSARSDGPRVVVSHVDDATRRRYEALPGVLGGALPEVERNFKVREWLVALMGDAGVRALVFDEVADWGDRPRDRIQSVMTTHCLSPLQLPDFAALCAMSLSSFKRAFEKVYGMAPGRWLAQVRLEHARSLVLHSEASILEVCLASGYRDHTSFSRAFRKAFGTSPSALRRPT